jgi:exopolysaccharide biosynthesis protein
MGGTIRFLTRLGARAGAAVTAALVLGLPLVAHAATPAPIGYRALRTQRLAPGVDHEVYQRFAPNEAVNVARISPKAPYALRSVPANTFLHGRHETTSEICRRTKCLVGINGDFWSGSDGGLLGALVHHGELLRSPTQAHYQLVFGPDGRPVAGALSWHGRLVMSDGKSLHLDGVNVPRKKDRLVLYSRSFARSTKTSHSGIELVLSIVEPAGEPRLGRPTIARIEKAFIGRGNTMITPGKLVLSGDGKGAEELRALWHSAKNRRVSSDIEVRLKTTPDALESIGGTPVLVRDGRPAFDDAATSFVQHQHPRTIVGWTKTGETLLVTVDGRQPVHSLGMTIPEAARMMIKLGAVDAINLDGGGSTTFVVRGQVLNKPSDRVVQIGGERRIVKTAAGRRTLATNVERPVASALVVVKRPPAPKVETKTAPPPTANPVETVLASRPRPEPRGWAHAAVVLRRPGNAAPLRSVAVVFLAGASLATVLLARRPRRRRARSDA